MTWRYSRRDQENSPRFCKKLAVAKWLCQGLGIFPRIEPQGLPGQFLGPALLALSQSGIGHRVKQQRVAGNLRRKTLGHVVQRLPCLLFHQLLDQGGKRLRVAALHLNQAAYGGNRLVVAAELLQAGDLKSPQSDDDLGRGLARRSRPTAIARPPPAWSMERAAAAGSSPERA